VSRLPCQLCRTKAEKAGAEKPDDASREAFDDLRELSFKLL
jgi:hypothetical protein